MRPAGNWIVHLAVALFAVVAAGPMTAGRAQAQQEVAADDPVTEPEIEQRTKLKEAIAPNTYSHAQVIRELSEEKRKIREAAKAGIEILNSEVDAEYARMASQMGQTVASMNENLARKGVAPETLKHRLHADMAWKRYQASRKQAQ
jgi:peptidyl-prolyl cis-trans isomerase SurA